MAPEGAAEKYIDEGLAALVYGEDVNGSTSRIAGLTDRSGRVLGLMPHPERFLWASHHYDRDWVGDGDGKGFGDQMFKSIYTTIAGEMAHEPG